MGKQTTASKKLRDFDADERLWFRSYRPLDFEEDGRHELSGLPRELGELVVEEELDPRSSPSMSDQLAWSSVACFGIVGLTVFALLASLAV